MEGRKRRGKGKTDASIQCWTESEREKRAKGKELDCLDRQSGR